jgi:hypothetical protein
VSVVEHESGRSKASSNFEIESSELRLLKVASGHPCSNHPLFEALATRTLSVDQAGCLLRNYDAHASVLRRLLLRAAAFMPEPAVGFVLENVRNEYGNGDYSRNHQAQLRNVASAAGVPQADYATAKINTHIRQFISLATTFYCPPRDSIPPGMLKAAIAAGAITATEVLAIKEFRYLQMAFSRFGLGDHIWFDHVSIEAEHSDDSLSLALYFTEHHHAIDSVEFGLRGVLDANVKLYDGLFECIQ